jgi:hypothetical protein
MSRSANLLARYKHLRQVGLELNTRLAKSLSRDALDEGGKKLGILKGKVLTLDTEDEIAVLMDYCLPSGEPHLAGHVTLLPDSEHREDRGTWHANTSDGNLATKSNSGGTCCSCGNPVGRQFGPSATPSG